MSPIHCTSCGAANAADAKFCQACGAKIQPIGESPPPSGDVSQGAQFPAGTPQPQYSERVPYRPYTPAAVAAEGPPVSNGELIGYGCLTLGLPVLGPIIGLILAIIWAANKRRNATGFLVFVVVVLFVGFFIVPIIAAIAVPTLISTRAAAIQSYAQGVLSTVRSAEAGYYIQNAKYATFGELAAGGFLDSRFQGTTFTERGIVFSISVGKDAQTYAAKAVMPKEAGGTLSLTENGEISGLAEGPFGASSSPPGPLAPLLKELTQESVRSNADGVLSTIRSAQAAYYAENAEYGDLGALSKAGFLDEKFKSNKIADFDGNKGLTLEFTNGKQSYKAVMTLPDGGKIVLTETGVITGP